MRARLTTRFAAAILWIATLGGEADAQTAATMDDTTSRIAAGRYASSDSVAIADDSTDPASLVSPPSPSDTILADIAATGLDAVALFSAPLDFGPRAWGIAFGAAGVWTTSLIADVPVRDAALGARSETGDQIARLANAYGTPEVAAVITGGTWLTGLLFGLPEVRRAGRHAAQAILYSGVIATATKWLVGRERPAFTGSPAVYVGPQSDDRYYSLPSGHATLAFALSSSLASDIDNPFATVALYGLATTTALSRIYVDRHWTSDVVLGALIGTACGWGVATLDDGGGARSSWIVVPTGRGLAVVGVF